MQPGQSHGARLGWLGLRAGTALHRWLAEKQQGNPQSEWSLAHPLLVDLHLDSAGDPN